MNIEKPQLNFLKLKYTFVLLIIFVFKINIFSITQTIINGNYWYFDNQTFSNLYQYDTLRLLFKEIEDVAVTKFFNNPLYLVINEVKNYWQPILETEKIPTCFSLDILYNRIIWQNYSWDSSDFKSKEAGKS